MTTNPIIVVADVGVRDAEAARHAEMTEEVLASRGASVEVTRVAGPQAAGREAASVIERGRRSLVVVGDDPAIGSIVDAMLEGVGPDEPPPTLGVIAAHASCDFVRTFGIPPDQPAFAASRLIDADPYPLDVAKVTYRDGSDEDRTTHMVGVAEIGFGGAAVRRAVGASGRAGRVRTFGSFWLTEASFRPCEVRVTGERKEFVGRAHDVVVGNCQCTRGGVRISPRSFPGDGILDLLIMTGPTSEQFRLLPKMFQGEHLPHPTIQEHRARHIRVEAERPLPLQVDGAFVGTTPVTFELIPGAISLQI